jgi:hypothetical protein
VVEAFRREGIDCALVDCCSRVLKSDHAAGLAFWNRLGGRERTDVLMVSLITGDNPNARRSAPQAAGSFLRGVQ